MKRIALLTVVLFTAVSTLSAQKLVIGEKAPDVKVKEWLSEKPADENKVRLVEFFHSSSKQCVARLPVLDGIAKKHGSKLSVILIAKESADKVRPQVSPSNRTFSTAIDDAGKTFDNFGVQFVPFSVLIDKKGRVVWFGNPASLTEEMIRKSF